MADSLDLSVGSMAPEITLPSSDGTEIKLVDFRSSKNVVLFFIREYI
jgi:peroxiredoxin